MRGVLQEVVTAYGPLALDAFAAESDALQRAFQVNYERRYDGRYRAGRRVGVANMRRFVVSEDLRLFQRIQVPDRLSYYFHLLVDVSPSMLTHANAQKAIAVGYAFAEALDRLRVPVDVSLYSTAVTELYDHRRDALDRYFGGDFGYLSSGTHEIEAIAWAKQKAERVAEERKIVVVVTDGHPNAVALHRAGSTDLRAYYQGTLRAVAACGRHRHHGHRHRHLADVPRRLGDHQLGVGVDRRVPPAAGRHHRPRTPQPRGPLAIARAANAYRAAPPAPRPGPDGAYTHTGSGQRSPSANRANRMSLTSMQGSSPTTISASTRPTIGPSWNP